MIQVVIFSISCPMLLVSIAGHIYVKLKLKPTDDLDDYHYEFEDSHPGLARYEKWCRITFTGVIVGMLGMFLAIVI